MTRKLASTTRTALSTVIGLAALTVGGPLWAVPLGRGSEADIDLWTPPRLRDDDGSASVPRLSGPLGDERWQSFVSIGVRWLQVNGVSGFEGSIALQFPLERVVRGPSFAASRVHRSENLELLSFSRSLEHESNPQHGESGLLDGVRPGPQPDARGLAEKTRGESSADRVTDIAPAFTPDLARACVRAAFRAAGLANEERLDGIAARARSSAALPELRLRIARTTDESGRLTYLDEDTARYVTSGSATYWLEGRLTFRLDRLIFADEELSVERIRLDRVEARSRIAGKVIKALSEWQRALAARTLEGASPEERMAAMIAELEAVATLDVLTDGWFTTQGLIRGSGR